MTPRCAHGDYPDKCSICIIAEAESDAAEMSNGQSCEQAVFIEGFWADGCQFQVIANADSVELHHLAVGGVRLPIEVLQAMVDALKREGVLS